MSDKNLSVWFNLTFLRYKAKIKFRNIERLLKGFKTKGTSDHRSIIIYSVHKSASTFLNLLSEKLSEDNKLIQIDPAGYFAYRQQDVAAKLSEESVRNKIFSCSGYIYGPLRWFVDIPDFSNYKVLLVLRDPRDVLVSYYFSMKYSHKIIHEDVLKERKEAETLSIDNYIMQKAEYFLKVYENYMLLLNMDNVLYVKYEDMISSPETFLENIQTKFEIKLSQSNYSKCIHELSPSSGGENIYKHKRSGKSRQFVEKLEPETVNYLNEYFHNVINTFGFDK